MERMIYQEALLHNIQHATNLLQNNEPSYFDLNQLIEVLQNHNKLVAEIENWRSSFEAKVHSQLEEERLIIVDKSNEIKRLKTELNNLSLSMPSPYAYDVLQQERDELKLINKNLEMKLEATTTIANDYMDWVEAGNQYRSFNDKLNEELNSIDKITEKAMKQLR
jgi:hypothetical protein